MKVEAQVTSNVFLTLARAMWMRGEDGETVAIELAKAFRAIVEEGNGEGTDIEEYKRLRGN